VTKDPIPRKRRNLALVVHALALAVYVMGGIVYLVQDGPLWGLILVVLLVGWQVFKLVFIGRRTRSV
jgi:hypothetical protein